MAYSEESAKNLELGRGKRPKLSHKTVSIRMSSQVKEELEKIAASFNCMYGGKPRIGELLEKIGTHQLSVTAAPPYVIPVTEKQPSVTATQSYVIPITVDDPRQAVHSVVGKKLTQLNQAASEQESNGATESPKPEELQTLSRQENQSEILAIGASAN